VYELELFKWYAIYLYLCVDILHVLQDVTFPSYVKIVEVGPRDGLQNEKVCEFLVLTFWSI